MKPLWEILGWTRLDTPIATDIFGKPADHDGCCDIHYLRPDSQGPYDWIDGTCAGPCEFTDADLIEWLRPRVDSLWAYDPHSDGPADLLADTIHLDAQLSTGRSWWRTQTEGASLHEALEAMVRVVDAADTPEANP